MKRSFIFRFLGVMLIVAVMVAAVSCDKEDEPEPDPGKEGTITEFTIQGIEEAEMEITMQGVTISALVPMGTDITSIVPVFTLSEEAELVNYTPGTPVDFSQPFVVQVLGSDGNTKTYQITITIDYRVDYGVGSVTKVWTLGQVERQWPDHAISGMCVSGDHVLVMHYGINETEIKVEYYNAMSGEYEGTVNIEGVETGRKLVSDAKGVILSSNVISDPDGEFKIYKWNDVTAEPELYLTWTHDITEHYGSEAKPWEKAYVGMADLSVKGDLSGDAVIFAPVSMTNIILRWTVSQGQLVSETPEKINYTFDNGRTNWEMTVGVAALGNQPTDDIIVNSSFELSLADANGNVKKLFNTTEEVAGSNDTEVFEFNNAMYAAMWQNGWDSGAKINVVDITKADYIDNTDGIRETDEINFWALSSEWFLYNTTNTNGTGAVDVKVADDGETAMVYLMATNAGIEAYELSIMADPNAEEETTE